MENDSIKQNLISKANEDFGAAESLFQSGYYSQALFWGHLVLEKYLKALWIHRNQSIDYPHTHNLLRLLKECKEEISETQIIFYAQMNQFQTVGRYGDTLRKLDTTISNIVCEELLNEVKNQTLWINSLMGSK